MDICDDEKIICACDRQYVCKPVHHAKDLEMNA